MSDTCLDCWHYHGSHARWCSTREGADIVWPFEGARPVFWRNRDEQRWEAAWLTCALGQELPKGWRHTGGSTISGEYLAEAVSQDALAFINELDRRFSWPIEALDPETA